MNKSISTISNAKAIYWVGIASLILALSTLVSAVTAYWPSHPDFSILRTYLSDIGDTPGWPQILFNSGTLMAVPLRVSFLLLFVLRLRDFSGKNRAFEIITILLGFLSASGTALMTAVPYSTAPAVHKAGIGLYFLTVVFMQSIIGIKEIKTKGIARLLPVLSFMVVICFLVFFVLIMLLEAGLVGRSTPVFWEWMCYFSSVSWLLGHTLLLGRNSNGRNERK